MLSPSLEVVYRGAPGRLNEDAWLAMPAGPHSEQLVLAAIDGATTRLTPPPLQRHLELLPTRLTPAAYSARTARHALMQQISAEGETPEPRSLVLEANAALGRALTDIFGALTLEALQFPPEVQAPLDHDPRLVRLGLPASVITLAHFDPASDSLRYAHAGDTLLLVGYQDGRVVVPTDEHPRGGRSDDDGGDDDNLKRTALQLRSVHPGKPFRELVREPEIQRLNLEAGLRHNYVDEHGMPQPRQGIGVIDGLPELRYFLKTGSVSLENAAFICLMTDGLEWPASAMEVFSQSAEEREHLRQQRLRIMAAEINALGLNGYLQRLWAALGEDVDHEQFPRLKTFDDATGVLLRFGPMAPPERDY